MEAFVSSQRRLRRITVVCLLLAALPVVGQRMRPAPVVAASSRATSATTHVDVRGDRMFRSRVGKALRLLRRSAPDAYADVCRYMRRIQQAQHSGMRAYDDPPTMDIGERTATSSTTWLAGAIAHDSIHSKLYHDHLARHGGRVPDDVWTGAAVERHCCEFQVRVLRKIKAPQGEIDWCIQQSNGDYSKIDYNARDW